MRFCAPAVKIFITSGALIFLMGCTYCGHELQLEVARCLEGLLRQIYQGSAELTEREAHMLTVMSGVEVCRSARDCETVTHILCRAQPYMARRDFGR